MKSYLVTILTLFFLLAFVEASPYNYCGPRNILFLLDQSSSVNRLCLSLYSQEECERRCAILEQDVDYCTFDNFSIAKDFVKSVLQKLDINQERTNIGILRFSSSDRIRYDVQLGTWPSEDMELLMIALDDMPYERGLTHTRLAIEQAGEYILKANETYGEYGSPDWFITAHNMMVVITDGASNDGKSVTGVDDPIPIAQYYRRQGIKIVTLGIGDGVNKNELKRIAGNDTNYYHVNNFQQLKTLENFIGNYIECPIEEELPIISEPEKPIVELGTNLTLIENSMDDQTTTSSKKDNTGIIVGATVGSICAILLILGGTFAWFKYKNRNQVNNEKLSDQIHGNVLNNPMHDGEGEFIENELYGTDI